MATTKPDFTRIWASGASPANVVDPDDTTPGKFAAGWLAEIPPFEHFNFLQQLFTQSSVYNNEQGINEWDTDTTYPINAIVKGSDGIIYKAISEQSSNDPISSPTYWYLPFQRNGVNTIAELRAIGWAPGEGQIIDVAGYYDESQNLGLKYRWDSTSVETDNGYDIIKVTVITTGRLILLGQWEINLEVFGLYKDGTNPGVNVTRFAALSTYLQTLTNGGSVYIPAGQFDIDAGISLFGNNIKYHGDNQAASKITTSDLGSDTVAITIGSDDSATSNLVLEDFIIINTHASSTGLKILEARYLNMSRVRIVGDGATTTGAEFTKNATTPSQFFGISTINSCNFDTNLIQLYLSDTVTTVYISDCNFIGVGGPLAGSIGIKIDPTSGNGSNIYSCEFEQLAIGIYSEGVKFGIEHCRFENNTTHIELVRGAGNARIWVMMVANTYEGTGGVIYPDNNIDFVSQFDVNGEPSDVLYARSQDIKMGAKFHRKNDVSLLDTVSAAVNIQVTAETPEYFKIGEINFTAQFQFISVIGKCSIFRGGLTDLKWKTFEITARQTAAMAAAPAGVITQNGLYADSLYAVTTTNDLSNTVIELWLYNQFPGINNILVYDVDYYGTDDVYFIQEIEDNLPSLPGGSQDLTPL